MVRVISTLWSWTRFITPYALRVAGVGLMLMLTSLASVWIGVPKATDEIATDWLIRALNSGWPSRWDRRLYFAFRVLAFLTVIAGWVLLSFTTVFILLWIF